MPKKVSGFKKFTRHVRAGLKKVGRSKEFKSLKKAAIKAGKQELSNLAHSGKAMEYKERALAKVAEKRAEAQKRIDKRVDKVLGKKK